MARQELDKVRNVKFYAEVTKRNRDTNGLDPLNSSRVPLNGIILKEKTISTAAHRAVQGVSQLKRNLFIAELHRLHPEIPSPKTTRRLSLNHRRKEGFPSLIQAMRIEL